MKTKPKFELTSSEKKSIKENRIKQSELTDFDTDELEVVIVVPKKRAKEIKALADFQQIPSIGIKFAQDLVFIGYYELQELKNKKVHQTDPCVEDQFRLVVDYANKKDPNKNWWD